MRLGLEVASWLAWVVSTSFGSARKSMRSMARILWRRGAGRICISELSGGGSGGEGGRGMQYHGAMKGAKRLLLVLLVELSYDLPMFVWFLWCAS